MVYTPLVIILHHAKLPSSAMHEHTTGNVGRCVELLEMPRDFFNNDIFRLFTRSSDKGVRLNCIRALRKFLPDFTTTGDWVVVFETERMAFEALDILAGRTVAFSRPHASVRPLSILDNYRPINELVEEAENCLLVAGPAVSMGSTGLLELFRDFKLRAGLLGSPVHFSENHLRALIEFESRDEAHRAFRRHVIEYNLKADFRNSESSKSIPVTLLQ